MDKKSFCEFFLAIEKSIIEDRRAIHSFAETGFDLPKTTKYVKERLEGMGLQTHEIGGGIVSMLGSKNGRTILLRADMDALNIAEKTGLPYAAQNGNMHACGHDMHTAMLLGAADVLSKIQDKINGRIAFAFQPAEETLKGAKRMIEDGLLDFVRPSAALMIHTLVGVTVSRNSAIVASAGVSAPSADFFEITIKGKSSHGSAPHLAADALSCGVKIMTMLDGIITREIPLSADAVISIGAFNSGSAANVIAEFAKIEGTFRTMDDNAREKLRCSVTNIVEAISKLYGADGDVSFYSGCPTLLNNAELSACVHTYVNELIGKNCIYSNELGWRGGGSEDFSYISHEIPSVMIGLMAGSAYDGFTCPAHNPKVVFDESALKLGAQIYAWCAYRYLSEL